MAKAIPDPAFLIIQMVVHGQRTPPKKILKPKTLALLKKQANQILKPEKPILSLLREDGTVIKTVDDLESGTIILASSRQRKDGQDPQTLSYQEIEEMDFIARGPKGSATTTSPFDRRIGQRGSVSFLASGGPIPARSGRESDWGSVTRSRSAYPSRHDGTDDGARSAAGRKRTAIKPCDLHLLLNDLLSNDDILGSLTVLINESDKKELLMKLIPLESQQSHAWYQGVMNQPLLNYAIHSAVLYDQTKRHATDVLTRHRFLSGKWVDHRLRLGIVGPRYSGKSILLGEIVNQLTTEMVFTGEWKSSFIFALDLLEVLPYVNDYPKLLGFMVNHVVDALAGQKLLLLESVQTLKRKLNAATKFGAAEPPASTRTPFDSIALRLSHLWQQNDGFFLFLSAVFQLPLHMAKAAGISNILIILDHFDKADIQLSPLLPFVEQHEYLFFAELLKYVLNGANFILACEDTDRFLQLMAPTDEEGMDLSEGMRMASTLDVLEDDINENRNDRFAVDVDGDDIPLQLHIGLCGGVVHFLAKWKELCGFMSRLDSGPQGEEFDDAQFAAINAAQEFVALVFNPSSVDEEIHISNVVRLPDATEF
jgi:hypothetical protein